MIDSSDPCASAMIVAQHDLELMLKEPLPHGPLLLTDCINLAKVGLILLKAIVGIGNEPLRAAEEAHEEQQTHQ